MIFLAASMKNMRTFTCYVTQAYVQSRTPLEIDVHIAPPKEMALDDSMVLKMVRQLYGMPESGLNLYITYVEHHTDQLGMKRPKVDPCVMLKHEDGRFTGMVSLQVDDSLEKGTVSFNEQEERQSKCFK